MLHILDRQNSLLNNFIAQLRDREIQRDSMRFRRNIERVGELTAMEISRELNYRPVTVETPLGRAEVMTISDTVVLATILRAGLPFHQGLLNYFDDAENAFVSAYRKSAPDGGFAIKVEYISCGSLEGKTLILADPMLATGSSLVCAYEALCAKGGQPVHTHFASVLASRQGVDYVLNHTDAGRVSLWCATVDGELNERKYIVPGLGDAGDLAFGEKIG